MPKRFGIVVDIAFRERTIPFFERKLPPCGALAVRNSRLALLMRFGTSSITSILVRFRELRQLFRYEQRRENDFTIQR
jgi:hypothetical protein